MDKKTTNAIIVFSVVVVVLLALMTLGGYGVDDNEDNYSIPVDLDAEYTYKSTADENQSYTIAEFEVEVINNTYAVRRTDDVPNPGTTLAVKEAQVVGDTLVITEEFVNNTGDNIEAPSVVSTSGYEKHWDLPLEINRIAIEHPYSDDPYIKEL